MTPIERICLYKPLLMSWKHDQYIPQARRLDVQDIANALHDMNPSFTLNSGCSGCVQDMLDMAYRLMVNHEAEVLKAQQNEMKIMEESLKPQFHTFPQHEPKKRGRKPKQ